MPFQDATAIQNMCFNPTPFWKEPIRRRLPIFVWKTLYQTVLGHHIYGFLSSEPVCLLSCQQYYDFTEKVSNSWGGICLWSLNSVKKSFWGVRHSIAIPWCCQGWDLWYTSYNHWHMPLSSLYAMQEVTKKLNVSTTHYHMTQLKCWCPRVMMNIRYLYRVEIIY